MIDARRLFGHGFDPRPLHQFYFHLSRVTPVGRLGFDSRLQRMETIRTNKRQSNANVCRRPKGRRITRRRERNPGTFTLKIYKHEYTNN